MLFALLFPHFRWYLQQRKNDDNGRVRIHPQEPVVSQTTVQFNLIGEEVHIPMKNVIKVPSVTRIRCSRLLAAVSQRYDWVEWGILFHDEKQGQPRYSHTLLSPYLTFFKLTEALCRFATWEWLDELRAVNAHGKMKLAGMSLVIGCFVSFEGFELSYMHHANRNCTGCENPIE
jgi:hypothetical protein